MKLSLLRRPIAMLLAVALLCSLVYIPGGRMKALSETLTVQELLGENWYVNWNGGACEDTDYLSIVSGGAQGDYALRIGHPTEKTDLCLRYQLYKSEMGLTAGQEAGIGMKFSAKVENALASGSWIGVINPVSNPGGGNRSNLSDAELASIGTAWTSIDKTADYYGVWCGPEYDRAELEFNIVLEPGSYFYLDDLQGYGFWGDIGDMAFVNVVKNGSFEDNQTEPETTQSQDGWTDVQKELGENWYVYWNGGTAADADYVTVVEGGSQGSNSLRIGHPTEKANICLRYKLYKTDLGMQANGEAGIGMKLYAKVEGKLSEGSWVGAINPVEPAAGGNRCNFADDVIAAIGSQWTALNENKDTAFGVWCGPEYDRAELEFNLVLDAGNYFYIDGLEGYGFWGSMTEDMAFVNGVEDGSFEACQVQPEATEPETTEPETTEPETTEPETTEPETTEPETTEPETTEPETTEPEPTQPVEITYAGAHKQPEGWYVSWNNQDQYRSSFLTTYAHSGKYALALTALQTEMSHTVATTVNGLQKDAEYIFEGYFRKTGSFSSVSLMMGSTFLQLKDWQIEDWTLCTGSFIAGTDSTFSIFTVCPQGGLLLADDLKIYRADDPNQTNLLENGDFEAAVSGASHMLKVDKAFEQVPVSVEAELCLTAEADRGGVLLSNLEKAGFTVGVNGQGQPYLCAVQADGEAAEAVFDEVDLRTGEKLTLKVMWENAQASCYVNEALLQTVAFEAPTDIWANAFALAGDHTPGNENYFTGSLFSLTLSSAQGVMAQWDLEKQKDPNVITDLTGNGYDAVYYGEYFDRLTEDTLEKYPYAFVAVGDTQYTNRGDTQKGNDYLGELYGWIVENREKYNIQAVLGLGDIADTSPSNADESTKAQSLKEWAHAVASIGKLHAAGIPYTLVKGNHDSIPEYPDNDTAVFENSMKDLGYHSQIQGWYEEGGSLANAYITLTVGQTKWLILTLDYNHSEAEIAWADSVVAAHPDHKVIITTHAYLSAQGQWLDTSDRCELVGQDLWELLIGKHENIEMVLSGHIHSTDVVVRQQGGAGDNIVTEMLIDSQSDDRDDYLAAGKAPFAMATLLMFSEDGSKVKVVNYSTGKDKFYRASAIQTLDMSDGQNIQDPVLKLPMEVPLEDVEIPAWITRWNGNEGTNYRYLTTHAHSGRYALALTGTDSALSYTYGQLMRKLEVGQEYTLEGYVLRSGKFRMLDLMVGGNANKLSLKELPEDQWSKVTMTFVPGESTMALELFGDARAKAIVLLDDVTVYKTSDSGKTNLLENPGFEVMETPQTKAPKKAFDYAVNWDIWAENDDNSQLFVTDTARDGSYGFAFVNTIKHASSLTQYVTGLEDGVYVLSAYVRSSGGQNDAALLAKGYDKENPAGQSGTKITKSGIWTRIELEFEVTSGQVQISLWNDGNKGNWIAVDQAELVKKDDASYTNLLKNSSFEQAKNGEQPLPTQPSEPTEPIGPTEPPMEVPLKETDIPDWVVRWNGNEGKRYHYLTTYAHSGKYALALIGKDSPIGHTYGQILQKLQVGAEYTFEGYVLRSGSFTMLDVLINGTVNKLSLKDIPAEEWVKVTLSFVAEKSSVPMEVFCNGPAGALFLMDDVTVYKTADKKQTNLINNPGFEVIEAAQTKAPKKVFDYAVNWGIWAENDDNTQLFVTDTARNGSYGFAFVNTAKHASSLTQYVTGLENGIYVLSAYVRSSGGQNDAALLAKGYDKENPAGQSGTKITKSGIWTRIELEFEVTSGQVQISVWNDGNKGNWIAVDQVELIAQNGSKNLLKNGGFEKVKNGEPPAPTQPPEPELPTEPSMEVPLEDVEIPGWVTRWTGNEGTNYRYLTTYAHSGKYALALTGTQSAISYTFGQLVRNLKVGETYTFEGYVLRSGSFKMLDLLISGTTNKLSLKDISADTWTKATLTFTAQDSTVPVEIFCDGPVGALFLMDDVKVYRTADKKQTNLVENPGFEVMEKPQTGAPEKAYDYPLDWEVWAENDDKSQLFVTNTAYAGKQAAAFVNTAKHASSLIQYVTGLENGIYVLSAYVRSSGGQNDAALLAKGYDKENPAGQSGTKIPKTGIWTRIELEFEVTSGQVQISIWNDGNPDNWIIVDQVELTKKNSRKNLLKNGGFEYAENELPPQTPISVSLTDRDIPGWTEGWNSNPGTNYRFLTDHAHSGSYALALTSQYGKIGYTFVQRLELKPGQSYTLEGYIYKSGELDAADVLVGPNGKDGKLCFSDKRMEGYEPFSLTFRTLDDYVEIGIYAAGPQGSLLMLDDLKLYENSDPERANLLVNGDFETLETEQTQPPVRTEDLPQGWEIWTDNNDLSTVFITEEGSIGFYTAAEQAASLTQTVTGLENGTYVLTAWVKSGGGQNDAAMLLKGYDQADPNAQAGTKIPKTGIWMQIRLEVEVSSGQVLVSFWHDANADNWMMVEDVCLYRKGDTSKTNLLVNGDFTEVLRAAGGDLPPAGELEGTQPPQGQIEDDTKEPEQPGGIPWIGYAAAAVLALAVICVVVIVAVSKERKKK